ncbi:hypothetical protein E4U42_003057 [Claviceps africana]|uniref:Nitroreductase domain-containing protein n=1 Tax=Claviceps africana TaxID=83212 RepID=A0A8K0NJ50_9HYPO|nr:hypothetical protein E4U42_003057 [Claviceps africana]
MASSNNLVTSEQWLAAARHRRTVYGIAGTSQVSDQKVQSIIEQVLSFAPSAYNTQPVRVTLVTAEKHKQLWDVIIRTAEPFLRAVSEDVWNALNGQFQAFKAAYGSVIFWTSGDSIKQAGEAHRSAAHMFGEFSEHANGMHQILVWTALELEGLGANLQHLNAIPNVEDAIKDFCQVPGDYKLKAHLNYGDEVQEHPPVPGKLPLSETFKVL